MRHSMEATSITKQSTINVHIYVSVQLLDSNLWTNTGSSINKETCLLLYTSTLAYIQYLITLLDYFMDFIYSYSMWNKL